MACVARINSTFGMAEIGQQESVLVVEVDGRRRKQDVFGSFRVGTWHVVPRPFVQNLSACEVLAPCSFRDTDSFVDSYVDFLLRIKIQFLRVSRSEVRPFLVRVISQTPARSGLLGIESVECGSERRTVVKSVIIWNFMLL